MHDADSQSFKFQCETRNLLYDMVLFMKVPYDHVLDSDSLDWIGPVISIYDQDISQALESMEEYPPHRMRDVMQKLEI